MPSLFSPLSRTLNLIIAKPKLFIPKLLLALIWGSLMVYSIELLQSVQQLTKTPALLLGEGALSQIFAGLAWFTLAFILAFLLDTFINALYPGLVEQYNSGKKISFSLAYRAILPKLGGIFYAIIGSTIVSFLALTPFCFGFAFALASKNFALMALTGALLIGALLFISGIFYLVNPIAVLEGKGFKSISKSISMAGRLAPAVSIAVLVSFGLSILAALGALWIGGIGWIGFLGARLLTSILATYQVALNPEVYLENSSKPLKGKA